jgi:hypothetical protein
VNPSGTALDTPDVHLLSAKQDGKFAQIEAEISDQQFPLQSYQIYVNNIPIFRGQGKPVVGLKARINERVELGQGQNKIEISAFNSEGAEALRARWSAVYRPFHTDPKGDLYYIGFGVSHYRNPALNLQFAHKDALDLESEFRHFTGSFRHVSRKHTLMRPSRAKTS